MINPDQELFRWGPIPGRLIAVDAWRFYYRSYNWPETYVLFKNGSMLFISEQAALEAAGRKTFWYLADPGRLIRLRRIWRKNVRALMTFCQSSEPKALQALSGEALTRRWREFQNHLRIFWETGILPELAAYGGAPILKEQLEQKGLPPDKIQSLRAILSAPEQLSFYQEEERDCLKLYQLRSGRALRKALEAHRRKYSWIENSYWRTKDLPAAYFRNKYRKLKPGWQGKYREMARHQQTIRQAKTTALKRLGNPGEIIKTSRILSQSIGWQDERKKYIFQYQLVLDRFINEFARRAKAPVRYFDNAWAREAKPLLTKREARALKLRLNRPFVAHFLKTSYRVLPDCSARPIFKRLWSSRSIRGVKQLTGIIAYSGTNQSVIGTVFVIRNHDDLKRFPAGRILVTTMTAPEYISAIRKAKAIVTDEGGITAHAAIVARELKIPCVVGTKIATKKFRTGDRIAIDTSKGEAEKA